MAIWEHFGILLSHFFFGLAALLYVWLVFVVATRSQQGLDLPVNITMFDDPKRTTEFTTNQTTGNDAAEEMEIKWTTKGMNYISLEKNPDETDAIQHQSTPKNIPF